MDGMTAFLTLMAMEFGPIIPKLFITRLLLAAGARIERCPVAWFGIVEHGDQIACRLGQLFRNLCDAGYRLADGGLLWF